MTDGWRALIVDDEPLAREGIRRRLEALGGFTVVGESDGGRAGVTAIRAECPDVVFLDIRMPVVDGFGVIAAVGVEEMPYTVFVTAHDDHALRAFDAQAVDYVLKPIDDARFARAVNGVRQRLADARERDVARRLASLVAELGSPVAGGSPPPPRSAERSALLSDRLVTRVGDRVEMVPFAEIDLVLADGDYVRIVAGNRQVMIRSTMAAMEASLPASELVRIHRSTIVNVSRIRSLRVLPNAEYDVVLRNGTTVRASRSYTDRLRRLFGIT